ncbi:MAG: 50S ribosomal protein L10 [Chloroflexi bacterium]|nr:50S ribosomal protein L10 [Chloroflexota bacterium]MCY4248578.1 50S ribosomal protein L10 [Chloroflexota bacterium]
MPISRTRKEELVAAYRDILSQSDGFIVVQTQSLGVSQVQGLRNALREHNGRYLVAKNTLMRKALEAADWVVPTELLVGPVAIVFGGDNMPGVSKALLNHMQEQGFEERMQVAGGVMAGDILDAEQVEAISKLPTLDELRAQLAGVALAPAQGVVNALQQATGGVVNVLQAYLDKHDDKAEAA